MKEKIKTIESAISSDRLLSYVEGFTQFHRIQASPGHRDAIHYMSERLQRNGVSTRVLSYPADYGVDYLGYYVFQEWDCKSAFLRVTEPVEMNLADFEGCPTSVIQKSGPCDYSRTPIDIVLLDKGPEEENYSGLDLRGKLIFIRGDFKPYIEWALHRRGAVGVVSDFSDGDRGTADWLDLAPISKYRSFWYYEKPEQTPFGFSIQPLEGEKLYELCRKMEKEHADDPQKPRYPQALCRVESGFARGHVEVLEAEVKGETDEEVWITAHSCHPRACANDNASGVAAAAEAISVINRLVAEHRLPPLKRTMKILLMPEFTGTYPYLANDANVEKCVGAINLDMVGGKQSLGYGPLNVVGVPYSTPSIVADLCGAVLNELKKEVPAISAGTYLPMFNSQRVIYSGGSDHLILTDPLMGIPTPMLLQWPDIFYHTGGDTLDKICPHLIAKSSALAACYAYLLCTMEASDLPWVFREAFHEFVRAANDAVETHNPNDGLALAQKLGYIHEFYDKSASSALILFNGEEKAEANTTVEKHRHLLKVTLEGLLTGIDEQRETENDKCETHVPKRTMKAVVIRTEHYTKTSEQKQARKRFDQTWGQKLRYAGAVQYLSQYYIDGKRTIDDIANRVLYETRGDCKEAIVQYIYLLRTLGICTF